MPSPNEEESLGITRRDTIIIAMLVNMAILFILFATAQRPLARTLEPTLESAHEPAVMTSDVPRAVANSTTNSGFPQKKQKTSTLPVDEIDQILQQYVPAKEPQKKQPPVKKQETSSSVKEPQYYIVKEGDNPWKIAKKFNIKFEELLERNNLDEAKARNLKVGQKLRIK